MLETERSPRSLLRALHESEAALGRTRGERWGPRSIDLDLLLYDDLEIDEPGLRVPHARMTERAFVLVPLAEIDERFAAMRDALPAAEVAGVIFLKRPRSVDGARENRLTMSEERSISVGERVRALANFLGDGDAVRVRIQRPNDEIEISRRPSRSVLQRSDDGATGTGAAPRIDAIKADLVGIFHTSRPAPVAGDLFDADRELGYVEALGIRTSVHSMGAGRLVSVKAADGEPVEYGQALFLVARGHGNPA